MGNRIYDYARRLYSGCGKEGTMMELVGLLQDMNEAYLTGGISRDELADLVEKTCTGIVADMEECGKKLDMDTCVKEVTEVVTKSMPAGGFRALRRSLASRRSTQSTGLKIL